MNLIPKSILSFFAIVCFVNSAVAESEKRISFSHLTFDRGTPVAANTYTTVANTTKPGAKELSTARASLGTAAIKDTAKKINLDCALTVASEAGFVNQKFKPGDKISSSTVNIFVEDLQGGCSTK
ncbi:hypothetical protein JNK13_00735 [bacterium]|nr:hypothetical protein [bacterium]